MELTPGESLVATTKGVSIKPTINHVVIDVDELG